MKTIVLISLLLLVVPKLNAQDQQNDPYHVFNFAIELELSNDQGDMDTREYLRDYGTKGKTRALDDLYPLLDSCFSLAMERKGIRVHALEEMSSLRSNVYGYPNLSLGKAIKSEMGTHYLKIHLKDIGFVNPEKAMVNSNTVKVVEMRCRLQLYDQDKTLVRTSEATFKTGEKVDPKYNLGVDLRQFMGSGRTQELKFYEVCCKMAFFRALDKF